MVLAGFKPVAGRREAAWVGSIPTRLRQKKMISIHYLRRVATFEFSPVLQGRERIASNVPRRVATL